MTQEQIAQSISAAFDSVNLVNGLNAKTDKTQDDLDTILRNVEHLIVMMSKKWFVNALTKTQKTAITKTISN